MIEQYGQSLAHFLQTHPSWGGILTFLVSFLESLAIIGTIIPGSVTMTAVGMLVGTAILPLGMTLFWATLGAFLGDLLGYWLGRHYNERLRNMWPFKKHPQWLETGESFFRRHGGKSILIGRFTGPLRSIIPMIAGILHMSWTKFIIAALFASFLWAIAYMLPGIIIGTVSMQLPPEVATKFILVLLLLIVVLSLFAWLIKFFWVQIRNFTHHILQRIWRRLQSNRHYDWFTRLIASHNSKDDVQQLGLAILATLMFALFMIVALGVFVHNDIILFNRPTFEFLRSLRNSKTDFLFIGITLLGDGRVLLISTLFVLGWLLVHHNKRSALHWLLAIAIGMIIPNLFKFILYFPRPTGLLHVSSTSSFPSGHTFLATMYYGFFSILVATHVQKKYRKYIYYGSSTLIALIGFSRLYLGAHWLTDIVGGLLLAIAFLALITVSYRRRIESLKILHFSLFTLIITFFIWSCYFILTYHKNITHYSLDWPSQVIDESAWWGRINPALPTYRTNRIGKPAEPMNVEFSGNIQQLKKVLTAQGWANNPNMTLLTNTIQKLSQTNISVTSFLPSLYLNRPPSLFMVKEDVNGGKLILKLWRSNVYLAGSWDVFYVGNISEFKINKKKITYTYNVTTPFMYFLGDNEWRLQVITANQIPPELIKQKWNGEILQISTPTLY